MSKQKKSTVFPGPFVGALEAAALFFLGYVFFAFGVIFLVRGDGSSPGITAAFLTLVESIGGLLGYRPHDSATIYVVGLVLSLVVFFAVLLIKILNAKSSD